jgi:hypothetical protein
MSNYNRRVCTNLKILIASRDIQHRLLSKISNKNKMAIKILQINWFGITIFLLKMKI